MYICIFNHVRLYYDHALTAGLVTQHNFGYSRRI